jgi:hypothetical protein
VIKYRSKAMSLPPGNLLGRSGSRPVRRRSSIGILQRETAWLFSRGALTSPLHQYRVLEGVQEWRRKRDRALGNIRDAITLPSHSGVAGRGSAICAASMAKVPMGFGA